MIAISTLAGKIQEGLNDNSLGLSYYIHADAGEYKEALKGHVPSERKRFTNGLLQVVSSSVRRSQGLIIATESVRLEVCVQLFNVVPDAQVIEAHRSLLDSYFQAATAAPQMLTDENGDDYSVSATYSLANTGVVEQPSPVGTSITFIVLISYGMVQNGLNSSKITVTLDGAEIAYSSFVISRVPTMESGTYSNGNGAVKNIANSTALAFNFDMPATTPFDAANSAIIGFLLDNDMQTVHTLAVTIADEQRTYDVVFAETNMTLEIPKNAGYSVQLVEAVVWEDEDNGA